MFRTPPFLFKPAAFLPRSLPKVGRAPQPSRQTLQCPASSAVFSDRANRLPFHHGRINPSWQASPCRARTTPPGRHQTQRNPRGPPTFQEGGSERPQAQARRRATSASYPHGELAMGSAWAAFHFGIADDRKPDRQPWSLNIPAALTVANPRSDEDLFYSATASFWNGACGRRSSSTRPPATFSAR